MTWYNLRTQIIYLLFDKYYDYLDYTYGNHMPTCVVQYILQQLGGQSVMLQPMTTTTTTTKVAGWLAGTGHHPYPCELPLLLLLCYMMFCYLDV